MKINEFRKIYERMQLCSCGNQMWGLIQRLLEIAEDHEKNGYFYDADDAPLPWIEFGGKVIDSWGLTTHGGNIGGAWLEADGELLLRWLRKFGTDDDEWPEDWNHSIGCTCGCESLEVDI
jgi:hypothetical protein